MGEDLRRYTPRLSTIMRETDPRRMEEQHRRALEDPALREALEQMRSAGNGRPTPAVPLPAAPTTRAGPSAERAQRPRRTLLVAAVAVAVAGITAALWIAAVSRGAPEVPRGTTLSPGP